MKKLDYDTVNTGTLLAIFQMATHPSRKNPNLEDITEMRNVIKKRRMAAATELKNLLIAENQMQKMVTNQLKSKMGR